METETAMGKRVVVLYRRSLLTQTVEGLLKGRKGLEVIGVDLDNKEAISQVEQAHPECIIVDNADLPESWSHLSFQLWRENPRIEFILPEYVPEQCGSGGWKAGGSEQHEGPGAGPGAPLERATDAVEKRQEWQVLWC